MSKENNRLTRFLSGKGFYAVLALCLAGAGAAAYLAMETATGLPAPVPPPPQPVVENPEPPIPILPPRLEEFKPSPLPEPNSPAEAAETKQPKVPQPAKPTMQLPLAGKVLTPYSKGELVKSETLGDWRTHDGVDLIAEEGTTVKAMGAGTVTRADADPLWGYVVEIDHQNGLTTYYYGLQKGLKVKAGEEIEAGSVLGKVGYLPAESSMPSHLHLACKRNGSWIDPMTLAK